MGGRYRQMHCYICGEYLSQCDCKMSILPEKEKQVKEEPTVMDCPSCGHKEFSVDPEAWQSYWKQEIRNADWVFECNKCHKTWTIRTRSACAECGQKVELSWLYCPKCGKKLR